jgi:6,7-dimethyl-8-ribityllumazine synthase
MAISTSELINTSGIQLNKDACVVIVRTEWNAHVIDKLQEGCIKILAEKGIKYKVVEVPGAIEIPFAIKNYWDNHGTGADRPFAFIALGCVIKGDTPHFEYVSSFVTNGILQLNLQIPVPTVFGVLTVNNQLQADERTGGAHGHKGEEAAATAIKMIALSQSFKRTVNT